MGGRKVIPLRERLLSKVRKDENGCWLWTAFINPSGYGMIGTFPRGVVRLAHRVSYLLEYGEFDQKLQVCHKCDVRHCVNPAHLFLGTHTDNMNDMARKGRAANKKGSANGRAKISEMTAQLIWAESKAGFSSKLIAESLGVALPSVQKIASGDTWTHACNYEAILKERL